MITFLNEIGIYKGKKRSITVYNTCIFIAQKLLLQKMWGTFPFESTIKIRNKYRAAPIKIPFPTALYILSKYERRVI